MVSADNNLQSFYIINDRYQTKAAPFHTDQRDGAILISWIWNTEVSVCPLSFIQILIPLNSFHNDIIILGSYLHHTHKKIVYKHMLEYFL